mgnify:CR=1 FL=1
MAWANGVEDWNNDLQGLSCDDTATIEGLLRFESMKAVSYPGGDRYKTYDQCEQNPFAEGCDG